MRVFRTLLLLSLAHGCAWIDDKDVAARLDVDGDSIERPRDCDDNDDTVGLETDWYADLDGDGFGDAASKVSACTAPANHVADTGDCNDGDGDIYPGADEYCDGLDNDCSGTIDDDVQLITFYRDGDGDGWGDENDTVTACAPPTGYVAQSGDCDDSTDLAAPGLTEVTCDALDNDCLGDGDGQLDLYFDDDGDGYGDSNQPTLLGCPGDPNLPLGYSFDGGDCDPIDPQVSPGATEVCNGIDDDCDNVTDPDSANGAPIWYADADGDGYGEGITGAPACVHPGGRVSNGADCDDARDDVHPGAPEYCDAVDNDCDTRTDDADTDVVDPTTWYFDEDGDTFGLTNTSVKSCIAPPSYVAQFDDCDDGEPAINPGADEICDAIDNDCDDDVDAADTDLDPAELQTYYFDQDGDGYGAQFQILLSCEPPAQYVVDNTDCDDQAATTFPGANEICDGLDNDCDLLADEDLSAIWYIDVDGDGFGLTSTAIDQCAQPVNGVHLDGDCDDTEAANFPGNDENCDAIDNNCDGLVDTFDPLLIADAWYIDTDSDGHGNSSVEILSCDQPAGYVSLDDDCDDTIATIYWGADEICDGLDNDCDALTDDDDPTLIADDWFYDQDLDGFGIGEAVIACAAPDVDFAPEPGDCDDRDNAFFPGAAEVCDELDNDCDGDIDDDDANLDTSTATQSYADVDTDLHGDPAAPFATPTCVAPAGHVFDDSDCDDADPTTHPDAPELCDALDHNCNGPPDDAPSTWSEDFDGDGYGNALVQIVQCTAPDGYVFDSTDCNDAVASVHPDAAEVCDSLDNDCDNLIDDDDDQVQGTSWWLDDDVDGYGADGTEVSRCNQPADHVLLSGDCDDINPNVNPNAAERCDFIDNDCDDLIDDADLDVADASNWYPDIDGDTYGDGAAGVLTCTQPEFYVSDDQDCLDDDFKIHPGASEICDLQDNDCNTLIDDNDPGVLNLVSWFDDADQDGYGDPSAVPIDACFQPTDEAPNSGDCDDTDAQIYPGAPLQCSVPAADHDCDGTPDVGAQDVLWFEDADSDGFGDPDVSVLACDAPDGWVTNNNDCNDAVALIAPGQPEVCDDAVDNDCDGLVDLEDPFTIGGGALYRDLDGDGYGDPADLLMSCGEPGYVANADDCDDDDITVYLGAPVTDLDINDGFDRDCDGFDECYEDLDGDSYGSDVVVPDLDFDGCNDPGTVQRNGDCQDDDIDAHPLAATSPADVADGLDRNCDGFEECYVDFDGDGSGAGAVVDGGILGADCTDSGMSADDMDCDDTDELRFPASPEWCGDGVDNDCDPLGLIDDADPGAVPVPWYLDFDGDGHGDSAFSVTTCIQPDAFVATDDDCDDRSPYADQIYPSAAELCDFLDNDCDLLVDAADPDFSGLCDPASMRFDDFTCSDEAAIGNNSALTGWEANWTDLWASDLNDGVSPTVDDATGTQGGAIDSAENFLLTGHGTWNNQAIQAVIHVAAPETGAAGLVARYASSDSYYQCVITNDVTPGCGATVAGSRVALVDVSGGCVDDDDYTLLDAPYSYPQDTDILMELQVTGSNVRCSVDADLDGVLGSGGDIVLEIVDPTPLSPGRAGLSAFGLGSDARFDDVRIDGFDGDQDGDGLSNTVDFLLGLGPVDPDFDNDAISDRDETLDPSNPPDTNANGIKDNKDLDSDSDGIADRSEAGDTALITPPDDSDCDGLPDYRDTDSDNDGIADGSDNCRTVANGTQTDTDSDGLGDDCDATPTNPDIDGDGVFDGVELAGGTDPGNPDTDGDGLNDGDEIAGGTNRLFSDTDHDGLSDFEEVIVHGTNPLSADSDGDGAKDGEEVDAGTNPLVFD